jgi:streptomycin 6-kinase
MPVDLTRTRAVAERVAADWGLELGEPFAFAHHSYAAPVSDDAVLRVAWEGDNESLHDGEALDLWDGRGAVRVLRRDRERRSLLLERARPGTDISALADDEATAIAVEVASLLWLPSRAPFRPVEPEVRRWLDEAEREGSELVPLARELAAELGAGADWVVHGDLHHHNILRHGERFVAIDPKPYLSDREYDVPSFLWNPIGCRLDDRAQTERRIAAFVAAGLDDFRIRAWTVIRGAYLRPEPEYVEPLRALVSGE